MKRRQTPTAAILVGVLLLLAVSAATGAAPRAQLDDFACQRGLDPPDRAVSVTAVMRPLPGTRRLALKFDLLASADQSGPQRTVRAGDLGVWITPKDPTLGQLPGDLWSFQKAVVELAPGDYRLRVAFRWMGDRGRSLGTVVRYSPWCLQRELRPDLLVRSVTVTPVADHPQEDLYTAVIANDGSSGAGPFNVLFASVSGSAPVTHSVAWLAAHSSRTETFIGPACTTADAPTITVDAANQIDDLNRANNAMLVTCPGSGSGP